MARHKRAPGGPPPIWRVPDELRAAIEPLVARSDPPARSGRKRIDAPAAVDAIVDRLRSGVPWNRLPREFPDDSSVHRTFQRWVRLGLFTRSWAALVAVRDATPPRRPTTMA